MKQVVIRVSIKINNYNVSLIGIRMLKQLLYQEIPHINPTKEYLSYYTYPYAAGIATKKEYQEGKKKLELFSKMNTHIITQSDQIGVDLMRAHKDLLTTYLELEPYYDDLPRATPLLIKMGRLRTNLLRMIDLIEWKNALNQSCRYYHK